MDYIGRGLTFRDADGTLGCPSTNVAQAIPEKNAANIAAGVLVGAWLLLYAWRTVVGHLSLATNAFDLSVFDYALWSLGHGGGGFVPFLGHSIFSHHFMPILWVLAPVHAVFPVPLTLLLVQLVAAAGAALLFLRLQRQHGLDNWLALGLMLVFLLSRRTHGALAGSFYPEAFQAPLTFAIVLLWPSRRWWFWPCLVLLLLTKEDAAVYVATFAAIAWMRSMGTRRRSIVALALAVAWFGFALFVAIPWSRAAEGLGPGNPILEARYGVAEGDVPFGSLVDRLLSERTVRTLVNLTASAGFLPLLGLPWLAPAAPGILANMVAPPDSLQAASIGHYAWPILPWLFLSASAGALWIQRRSRKLAAAWVALLLLVTMADNPALRRSFSTRIPPEARAVREQLARVTGETILAQPNLIPHIPKTTRVFAIGGDRQPDTPDLVLLAQVGNLWPLDPERIDSLVAQYRNDARYIEVASGPLFAFKLR